MQWMQSRPHPSGLEVFPVITYMGHSGPQEVAVYGSSFMVSLRQLVDLLFQDYFWKHFAARAVGLIVIPFIIYLSFFWVHFALLPISGTGDSFMSPAFQETLAGNDMLMSSQGPCIE